MLGKKPLQVFDASGATGRGPHELTSATPPQQSWHALETPLLAEQNNPCLKHQAIGRKNAEDGLQVQEILHLIMVVAHFFIGLRTLF